MFFQFEKENGNYIQVIRDTCDVTIKTCINGKISNFQKPGYLNHYGFPDVMEMVNSIIYGHGSYIKNNRFQLSFHDLFLTCDKITIREKQSRDFIVYEITIEHQGIMIWLRCRSGYFKQIINVLQPMSYYSKDKLEIIHHLVGVCCLLKLLIDKSVCVI